MLNSLKDYLPWLNLVLNFVGLIGIPTLIVLGILKPYSNAKTRMKKKIIQKLNQEANRGEIFVPELMLRDYLLFRRILVKSDFFLSKFYTVFIESIRELETEKEISRVSNWDLVNVNESIEENCPPYSSKAKKTPARYDLKEDDPDQYLGLNSIDVQNHLENVKRNNASYFKRVRKANSL